MGQVQVDNLVASAQRRTASRAEAHQQLNVDIEALDLDEADELALRTEVYRRLFPEHASRVG